MVGFFGARGTGKTVGAVRHIKAARAPRFVAWDFKHDPRLEGIGRPIDSMPALIRAMAAPRWQLRYLVDHDADIKAQFDLFCRAAWLAGDAVVYVGELPEVTAPGRAPAAWKKIVNVGREYRRADGHVVGLSIVGDGQRLAECDKSYTGNLDVIRCGRMGNEADARAAAALLNCDWRALLTLPDLDYFERRFGATAERGRLHFGKKISAPAANP